jgi:hypothetical protein
MNFTSKTPFGDVIERNVTLDEITGTGGFVVAAIDAPGHGDRPRSTQGQQWIGSRPILGHMHPRNDLVCRQMPSVTSKTMHWKYRAAECAAHACVLQRSRLSADATLAPAAGRRLLTSI